MTINISLHFISWVFYSIYADRYILAIAIFVFWLIVKSVRIVLLDVPVLDNKQTQICWDSCSIVNEHEVYVFNKFNKMIGFISYKYIIIIWNEIFLHVDVG